ncbi:MAG: GIY-YIG nuclease family protein [Thermodesulfovibrionales bacterium]|jgi:group I intron endonuclease
MPFGVYQILNEVNGNIYIGSTSRNFEQRWNEHLSALLRGIHHSCHLQNAYLKYGKNAFRFSIVEVVDKPEDVISREDYYIKLLKPEYNICPNASSCLGRISSEEHKKNMSISQKGRVFSPEHRKKLSIAHMGKKLSEERREKLLNSLYGNMHTLGYKHSAETIKKLRERRLSEETKAKISMTLIGNQRSMGYKHSEETRAKMRDGQRLRRLKERPHEN